MPRSGPNGTYTLPGAQATQQPGTPIPSAVNNQGYSDIEQTFNTIQPRAYGGTDSNDLKLNDANFGVRNNADATKIGVFNAAGLPTATTRTYDLPYYSGTLGLVSDIRGQLFGLTLSNEAGDLTNDIAFAAGSAVDSTGVTSMLLAAPLVKRADATWVAGTNQGGRFYTTLIDGTIHCYLIRNPTTGVVDTGFSDNASNPTGGSAYPSGFTQYRRVGSIIRAAGSIFGFVQRGDEFLLFVPTTDVTSNNPGTSEQFRTLRVPTGIVTNAIVNLSIENSGSGVIFGVLLTASDTTNTAPSLTSGFMTVGGAINSAGGSRYMSGQATVKANTSGSIRTRASASDANCTFWISTIGWVDTRGRFA